MIHEAVLDACDADDGVNDRLIQDPTRCQFDPNVLVCKGEDGPTCLTPPQAAAVATIMKPVRTGSGAEIFPRREPGSELGWGFLFARPDPPPLVADTFKYLLYKDPQWDWRTFDLDRDVERAEASPEIRSADAIDPNLKAFVQRRGRLLMYHGWSDPLVAPRASVNYYNDVLARMGGAARASEWIRLFMVPGMGHCRGGDGPSTFDAVGALEAWVEDGKPPERIVASHATDGRVERTRPLCPYPQLAVYKGTGSIDEAANFTCRAR
jgi:feruloyl esterase